MFNSALACLDCLDIETYTYYSIRGQTKVASWPCNNAALFWIVEQHKLNTKKLNKLALAIASALVVAAGTAQAQATYPGSKAVRIVVPFPAGGATDALARTLATGLASSTGGKFIVENKPGAGSNLGSEWVARAAPDGYTLLMGSAANAINETIYKKDRFVFARDLRPISLVATVPIVLVSSPASPYVDVGAVVKAAKAKPSELNVASAGTGTSTHLAGELFQSMADIRMTHVPYRGSSPALVDVMGGQLPLMFDNLPSSLPLINAGKLRAVAVTTQARNPALPNVPTLDEAGIKGYKASNWFGLFAPAGTPDAIITMLAKEVQAQMAKPEIRKIVSDGGSEPTSNSPDEFSKMVKEEIAAWGAIARKANVQVD